MSTDQARVQAQHDQPTTVGSHQPTDHPSTDQAPVALSQFWSTLYPGHWHGSGLRF